MKIKLGLPWLLLVIFSSVAVGQNPATPIASLKPEQPKWGTTLTITYHPKAEGAKLAATSDIYLSGWMVFSDHSTRRMQARMNQVDGLFKYEMPVEKTWPTLLSASSRSVVGIPRRS